jgi:hypothetical protein
VRVLERLERNDGITLETIALFIRFWLTSTPASRPQTPSLSRTVTLRRAEAACLWKPPLMRERLDDMHARFDDSRLFDERSLSCRKISGPQIIYCTKPLRGRQSIGG